MRPAHMLCALLCVAAVATGCSRLIHAVGGASSRDPAALKSEVSPQARQLLVEAFEGIDPKKLVDYHTHIVGLGAGGTGLYVNPRMRSWSHPLHRLKFEVYLSAVGVKDLERADAEMVERLVSLIRGWPQPGRHHILAFDAVYNEAGERQDALTEFYVPNEYILALRDQHPDLFLPTASVHPSRKDALEELEKIAAGGARFIKWLPNAMRIDPADDALTPFYEKMKALDLILLSHAGEEKAVEADDAQKLGNPLRLRKPLEMGVRVVVAHCASLGKGEDLDAAKPYPKVDNFDLFIRMMDEPRYEGLLFGEISAMLQANRVGHPLRTLLAREDLHARLVNGSDYPLPAINVLVRTGDLLSKGYITAKQRKALNEIYDYNPLLFDFVLKRTIRMPGGKGQRFAASVFMENPGLAPRPAEDAAP